MSLIQKQNVSIKLVLVCFVCVCMCVCVSVYVCKREGEREFCVRERESEKVCVKDARERDSV